ncbi:DUF3089 domain-containing protein [Sphingomonas colocasiae]|uniref:DUF3089 domain-containing protein n=1 Tax=Sphingomonas colocasiae TaxID=1848973 RepID=A0ABS7PIJ4_9SPHN|nr:DUF3089 domain-containing protein [Sphingomonas colocasiae]MBY8821122.1 DUF3089 domain-containing protein [Sphingomonas colocasiae]
MARKFLYVFATLIVLAIAATFAYRLFGVQMMRTAMVPSAQFKALPATDAGAYADRKLWLARPDITQGNPALWAPQGLAPAPAPRAAVFFIHPTSYLNRAAWNAPLDDAEANDRAALFLRGQASAFNEAGAIWAPRYRQATFGAFLTGQAEADKALALAYGDVLAAFDHFIGSIPADQPIILAGHSQGALHLTRLLRERVAGKPLAARIVAAYVVGWPVSRTTDLPALAMPECTAADQTGCLLSWQSFAEPAEPEAVLETYDGSTGFDGKPRKDTPMVCTNPLTGMAGGTAPMTANLGTLVPSADLKTATLTPGAVPARCDARGFLLIGDPPAMGPYVLPGNNYHVYDYSLFWANVRADAVRRLAAYKAP